MENLDVEITYNNFSVTINFYPASEDEHSRIMELIKKINSMPEISVSLWSTVKVETTLE